jgi:hypothetical protein
MLKEQQIYSKEYTMNLTYENDRSFFITIIPPFVYNSEVVTTWLLENEKSKFRYIRDQQCEEECFNIQQINEYYPGIKTIAMIINPWTRMVNAFQQLQNYKLSPSPEHKIPWEILSLDSFDDFIFSLKNPKPIFDYWFTLATPQIKWLEDGDLKADYILKAETLAEDFRPIREYFCSDDELILESLDHIQDRQYYNETTKKIVEEVFKEDIEKFGYNF